MRTPGRRTATLVLSALAGVVLTASAPMASATDASSPAAGASPASLFLWKPTRFAVPVPWGAVSLAPRYGEDARLFGVVQGPWSTPFQRIGLTDQAGHEVAWTRADTAGGFELRWRPREVGPYTLKSDPGGVQAQLVVRVRPVVVLDPRRMKATPTRGRVIPLQPGRRIVVSGWARPRGLTSAGSVQLQYQSRGVWVDLASGHPVGESGSWILRYQLRRRAHVDAWMRVAFRSSGSEEVSVPFVVPLR
jgi:hypothetical protein